MRSIHIQHLCMTIGTVAALSAAPVARDALAQTRQSELSARGRTPAASTEDDDAEEEASYRFKSAADSASWARGRSLAARSKGYRIIVSLKDRHVWAVKGRDTLLSAPAAVAKGTTLEYGNSEWRFITPRGVRRVLGKDADPIWQPPEWLYAETALANGLRLRHIRVGSPIRLPDGRILTVRNGYVGVINGGVFGALPVDEHIVFDGKLFVPPMGTKNRQVEGELGKYRLNLGDGYLLHGTPYKESIGLAATHGCIRLRDEDIEWLYDNIPIGTKVYIY